MLKRLFKLICFGVPLMLLQAYSAQGQVLLDENFDYATGQLTVVSSGNWVNFSGTGNYIQVSSGSLSYSGYPSSGTGNKIEIVSATTSAEDAYRSFSQYQLAGATVYGSFLINLANTTNLAVSGHATGEYFAGLMPVTGTSVYVNRVCIRQGVAANTFNLGLRATSSNATVEWHAADLAIGTTYLVIMRYQMVPGGTNDIAALFINPVLGGGEPSPDLSQVSALATDPDSIGRFALRQGSSTGPITTPNASIDGIRAGTTWGYITGATAANPAVISVSPVNNASNVLPSSTIQVTFDKLMNSATIDTASFAVAGVRQARYYPDSIRPATNSTSYTFYVQDSLRTSDTVTVTLSTAITDTAGNPLYSAYTWKFHTLLPETVRPYLVSTSPSDGAARIPVSSEVVLTFNEALLPASVDSSDFEISGKKRPSYPLNAPLLSSGNTVVTLGLADSLYSGDTVTVRIKPGFTDLSGNFPLADSIVFTTRTSPNLTIYDIQYTTGGSPGTSPYDTKPVTVSGIVTAVLKTGAFFIQDGPGQWNGIYIYKYSEVAVPEMGDSVTVTGDVSEWHGLTEITVKLAGNLTTHKKGCALPAPSVVTTGNITSAWSASSESYESVLIEVRNVAVTALDTVYKEWQINDGSGASTVNDFIATSAEIGYNPVIGDTLVHVRGIVECYDNFKIEPRMMGDVMDNKPVKIAATNPANNSVNVPTAASIQVNFNKPMRQSVLVPGNFALSGSISGAISFSVEPDTANWACHLIPSRSFASGESIRVVAYHTLSDSFGRTLDGNGDGVSVNDSTDDYSFRFVTLSGGIPIGEIQKPGPDGFASNLAGQIVTIEGIVTGPDKYFSSSTASNASWYIQDNTGGLNVYGGTKNVFLLGRRVVVSGTVTEYNGITEVSSSSTSISIWSYARDLVQPKVMVYNQLLGESIEGLLVTVEGTVSGIPAYAGGGYNMEIRNGNATIAVRISESSGFNLTPFVYGARVRVTGIVSQYDKEPPYNSGYQLVPRFGSAYTYDGVEYPPDMVVLADTTAASASSEIVSIKPNPFSPDQGQAGVIELNAPSGDHLTLRIYDLKGRLIKNCLNNVPGGHQYYYWDGTDDSHRRVCIGMYIVHLRTVTAEGAITDKTKVIVLATEL